MPEPFLVLSFFFLALADLAGQAQIPAILASGQLGHAGDLLAALAANPLAILFHTEWYRGPAPDATLEDSGRGAAWLARLLGVQEVPGSNPGGPTKFRTDLQSDKRV